MLLFLSCFSLLIFANVAYAQKRIAVVNAINSKAIYKIVDDLKIEFAGTASFNFMDAKIEKKMVAQLEEYDFVLCIGDSFLNAIQLSEKPGLFMFIDDPIKRDLTSNRSIPLTKMTGISVQLSPKAQFNILEKVLPECTRIGLVYDLSKSSQIVDDLMKEGKNRGYTFIEEMVNPDSNILSSFQKIRESVDAFLLLVDSTVVNTASFPSIVKFSVLNKIPVIGFNQSMSKAGLLLSIHLDMNSFAKTVTNQIKRYLSGEVTQSTPIHYPEYVKYSVNIATADAFKVKLNSDILKEAENKF